MNRRNLISSLLLAPCASTAAAPASGVVGLSFGQALDLLKEGHYVSRPSLLKSAKRMYFFLSSEETSFLPRKWYAIRMEGMPERIRPASDTRVPAVGLNFTAPNPKYRHTKQEHLSHFSVQDCLAEDWLDLGKKDPYPGAM